MIARILMTLGTLSYGVVPLIMDLSKTHVFHPDWPGHARFHNVWLLGISTLLGVWSLWLLWGPQSNRSAAINRAGQFGLLVYGSFFIAVLLAPAYGGALADPGGVEQVAEGVYGNVISFSVALLMLVAGWVMSGKRKEA